MRLLLRLDELQPDSMSDGWRQPDRFTSIVATRLESILFQGGVDLLKASDIDSCRNLSTVHRAFFKEEDVSSRQYGIFSFAQRATGAASGYLRIAACAMTSYC